MFKNQTRKTISEHGWFGTIGRGSNPPQSRNRIKDLSREALSDLTLVAQKIPEVEFNEVFHEDNIRKFLMALFYSKERQSFDHFMYNAELASVLVEIGVNVCVAKYEIDNNQTPNSAKPVIERLNNTIDICKEIGHISKIERIEKESKGNYICMLDDVDKDSARFDDYLIRELKITPFFEKTTKYIEQDSLHKEIIITIRHLGNEDYIGTVRLDIDLVRLVCLMSYSPFEGLDVKKELRLKKRGNNYTLLQK